MRITSGGNVLVNATTSSYGSASGYNLGVKGISSQAFISIARSTQALDSQGLVMGIDTSEGSIYVRDNLPLTIYTNNTFVARFGANGNVLIGTTTDSGYKLDVNGTGRISLNQNASTWLKVQNSNAGSGAAAGLLMTNDGGDLGAISLLSSGNSPANGLFIRTLSTNSLILGTNNTANLTITSTGAATFSSSVTATGYFESSSVAYKNILATNPTTALNVDVIKYTRKNVDTDDVRYGYSAEQINSLMPELTNKDVTAVKYLDVHTLLIAELQREIKELKSKLK
jgi:hypothetical protein